MFPLHTKMKRASITEWSAAQARMEEAAFPSRAERMSWRNAARMAGRADDIAGAPAGWGERVSLGILKNFVSLQSLGIAPFKLASRFNLAYQLWPVDQR